MFRFKQRGVFVIVAAAVVLVSMAATVFAFNPQPEPPADTWKVEGFVDMTALTSEPTGVGNPFHFDPSLIGDGLVDFRGGIVATFVAPTNAFTGKPQDGLYYPTMDYFRLRIGNTSWDETMIPAESIDFQLQGGLVTGVGGVITFTRPEHPDLALFLPSSPGAWMATDERGGVNLGTISGEYGLRDGIVPEPGTLALLLTGGLLFNCYLKR